MWSREGWGSLLGLFPLAISSIPLSARSRGTLVLSISRYYYSWFPIPSRLRWLPEKRVLDLLLASLWICPPVSHYWYVHLTRVGKNGTRRAAKSSSNLLIDPSTFSWKNPLQEYAPISPDASTFERKKKGKRSPRKCQMSIKSTHFPHPSAPAKTPLHPLHHPSEDPIGLQKHFCVNVSKILTNPSCRSIMITPSIPH